MYCRPVAFYNSLGQTRVSLVRVYVDHPHLEVKDTAGQVIYSQVDPYWLDSEHASTNIFKVCKIISDRGYYY